MKPSPRLLNYTCCRSLLHYTMHFNVLKFGFLYMFEVERFNFHALWCSTRDAWMANGQDCFINCRILCFANIFINGGRVWKLRYEKL
ncbi:hypothetical protein SAMN05518847_105327 [Paenibacillus sp. OV219]|nr:hypothetical protein SAMN05518847_105327 [Paenibacillus sp. OV219]